MSFLRCICLALILLIMTVSANACLWDRDTVRDEEQGLPGIKELLAGKFEKHSRLYYQTRVAHLLPLIEREPGNLAASDDLAVAYEKLEDRDSAIQVMLRKESVKPNEYTTYANLGTFYLHKGELEPGIRYIRKALEVNPNAHFGREIYQLKLAEFLLALKGDPELATKENFLHKDFDAILGPEFRLRGYRGTDPIAELGLKPNVIDGITGMLRFGTGKSAELWYVLGELLAARGERHVAYAAYRKAIENGHPRSDFIRETCMTQVQRRLERTNNWDDDLITRERAEGDRWVKSYQDFEDALIRAGRDPDDAANLAAFYKENGSRELRVPPANLSERFLDRVGFAPNSIEAKLILFAAGILVVGLVLLLLMIRWLRRARASRTNRLHKASAS